MTIPALDDGRDDYVGTGAVTVYPYNFMIFDESELLVKKATPAGVETTLVLNTDYTVSGVGESAGGNVTLTEALPASYALTILRVPEMAQETSFANQETFYPEAHEAALDRLTMIVKYLNDLMARALKLKATEAGSAAATEIPTAAERASLVLGFDASGDPIAVAGLSDVLVTGYMETLLDDEDAAAALTTLGISAFAQTLLDDADAAAFLATLGSSSFGAALFGTVSPDSIGTDQDDYAIADSTYSAALVRLTSDADVKLTGLTGGAVGKERKIVNIGAYNVTLADENAGSAAANRIITGAGADLTLGPLESATLRYDATSSRWRVVA